MPGAMLTLWPTALPGWAVLLPALALAALLASQGRPLGGLALAGIGLCLVASVLVAVHHAEWWPTGWASPLAH